MTEMTSFEEKIKTKVFRHITEGKYLKLTQNQKGAWNTKEPSFAATLTYDLAEAWQGNLPRNITGFLRLAFWKEPFLVSRFEEVAVEKTITLSLLGKVC